MAVLTCAAGLAAGCGNAVDVVWTPNDGTLTIPEGSTLILGECFAVGEVTVDDGLVDALTEQPRGRALALFQMQSAFATSGATDAVTESLAVPEETFLEAAKADGSGTRFVLGTSVDPLVQDPGEGWVTQVCAIPHYESIVIEAGGTLTVDAWDGSHGGMLAFTADRLVVDGTIRVTGAGFRGGELRPDTGDNSIVDLDLDNTGLAGGKGEGLDGRAWGLSARGNYGNGAGGGNAHNAGGGGGGNGGAGGFGGKQWPANDGSNDNPDTRGLGGARVEVDNSLAFGGGGGAGHQNDTVGGAGGHGGGSIWIRVGELHGSGTIEANGLDGGTAQIHPTNGDRRDGAGGGGAGGTIRIQAEVSDFSGALTATGGHGGDNSLANQDIYGLGPGGGGGGGRIYTIGWTPDTADVTAGANGQWTGTAGPLDWGATPGEDGVVVTD